MLTLKESNLNFYEKKFADHINLAVADNGIEFSKVLSDNFKIEYEDNKVMVFYTKKSEIFKGLSIIKEKIKENIPFKADFTSKLDSLSVMYDCSRNAVPKIETLKSFVMDIATLGYDQLQLYTEDTFEIKERPYFGYMRGRYSVKEIKELDAFANEYGIELVPAIQTLAHLRTIFRWNDFKNIQDVDDILLCDDENTYEFIEQMIASLREMYSTNKINIGMDEAHLLGFGKYFQVNGYVPKMEIFLKHINRVLKIIEKYDFSPMMWSDMFFKIATGHCTFERLEAVEFDDETISLIPENLSLIYWNYSAYPQEYYDVMMKAHLDMNHKVIFAGGTQKWVGFCPNLRNAINASRTALSSVFAYKIKDVIVTAWGDDGAVGSLYLTLPILALYSSAVYGNDMSDDAVDSILKSNFNRSLYEFILLEQPNRMPGNEADTKLLNSNTNRILLWNDPIVGIYDKHIIEGCNEKCNEIADLLKKSLNKKDRLNHVFETIYYLCDFLSLKSELSNKIRKAYQNKDKKELCIIAEQLPEIILKLDKFHSAFRKNWNIENKPFGFEVQDIRFGGLRARLLYTKEIIETYLKGKVSAIPELEEELLYSDCREESSIEPLHKYENLWTDIATVNILK